jgi:ribosomal protein S18 acetylase RimI-like enzyme
VLFVFPCIHELFYGTVSLRSKVNKRVIRKEKETGSMISRPVSMPADFTLIDELLHSCETQDAIDLNLHRQALQEKQTTTELFQIWLNDTGQLQGFARLHFSQLDDLTEGRYWYYARPTTPNRVQRISTSMLKWAEQETQKRQIGIKVRLSTASREDHSIRFQFLEASVFSRERYFFTMKQDLRENLPAPVLPKSYTFRQPTLDDIENYTDLHNQTFRERWNSQPITIDELRASQLDHEYQPELDTLAVTADNTLVSFCTATIEQTKREGHDEMIGFIASLGTDPAHRGRGIGRALLLHTLQTIYNLGIHKSLISVDAANPTGALHLYESVGFQTFETWIYYFKYL